ncbi:3,4-dihydroxy-2-butanone-4-phosphate synthase [Sinomonas sp. P47F7]|uniref:3,4-dihydroxy-2-butanone-4-phosphate synthase n=1 Tax=Sinomonas sp. P47F7 TaxID=3410987 RepID=UPI003BF5E757
MREQSGLSDLDGALEALEGLRQGRRVTAVDDEGRENEGDMIPAAEQAAPPEMLPWTIRGTSGLVCAPMINEVADALDLPLMTEKKRETL